MKISRYGTKIVVTYTIVHGLHGFSIMVFKLWDVCHENCGHWWQWADW